MFSCRLSPSFEWVSMLFPQQSHKPCFYRHESLLPS
uniref:Uncharacterized protein n=1 Tax=Brassica oleracea TaxID=3712 RepID=A0A3P6D7J9_BRAOL|nr:unnamed protein product [Brassica oleracea]